MGRKAFDQTGSYMPNSDAGFKSWLENFSNLISQNPGMFGLDESDAAAIRNHYTAYATLFAAVQAPMTRTSNTIAQKEAAKAAARASCRVYAMLIKANVAVSNDDKIALGLHVNDSTPTPIPAPETAPMLFIAASFSGEQIIRYADEMTPNLRRKAYGAIQIELYVYIGDTATADFNQAKFVGAFGKNPIHYNFQPEDAGKIATYFARWRTRRGLVGPWSAPVCMTIAFGGPVEQQMFHPDGGTPGTKTGEDGFDGKLVA